MKKIKTVANDMFIIVTCMIVGLGIQEIFIHFSTNMQSFETPWYIPITIPVTAFICALPSVLINDYDGLNKMQIACRVILHYVCLYLVISSCGFIFKWYSSMPEYLVVIVVFTVIYIMVWIISWWLEKRDEALINSALILTRDEE